MIKVGFIGGGNMGGALARAVSLTDTKIYISDASKERAEALAKKTGGECTTNSRIAEECDLIFFAVKPSVLPCVISEIKDRIDSRKNAPTLVSMAAGVSVSKIETMLGTAYPIIRIMPNTPVSVGDGMILWCTNENVGEDRKTDFTTSLVKAGELESISESLIDAASAVSGCGPAFVYMFIEALADGAVECGLPREKAMKLAIQTVLGASTLAKQSGEHPAVLKDAVCSPGGSTIAGVHALESDSFRAAAMDAVKASFEKTKELGK